jgi:uncharacterized protein (DUF58 family)
MATSRRFLASACLVIFSFNVSPTGSFTLGSHLMKDSDRSVDSFSFQRRGMLLSTIPSTFLLVVGLPSPSYAGEVGTRINAAITKSELGVAVRESVVRGAQVMDKIDGQWEQFSDKFGLGSARSKQDKKPTPKVIPDPLPLDTAIAKRLVEITDQVCTQAKQMSAIGESIYSFVFLNFGLLCYHRRFYH